MCCQEYASCLSSECSRTYRYSNGQVSLQTIPLPLFLLWKFSYLIFLLPYFRIGLVHCFFYVLCFCRLTEESVYLPALWQSAVLESKPQASHCRQACGAPGRVPLRHLRTRVLLAQQSHDAHLYLPQNTARRSWY